ncbi:unnamed protein product [Aphanomyces euteiches]
MLPKVLLTLSGSSTATTATGRRVELYHVTMKHHSTARNSKIRFKALRRCFIQLERVGNLRLALPPKHPLHSSSDFDVVRQRNQMFRDCMREISSVHLNQAQVEMLISLFDAADTAISSYRFPSQPKETDPSTKDKGSEGRQDTDNQATTDTSTAEQPRINNPEADEQTDDIVEEIVPPNPYTTLKLALGQQISHSRRDTDLWDIEIADYFVRLADELFRKIPVPPSECKDFPPKPSRQSVPIHSVGPDLVYSADDEAYIERLGQDMMLYLIDEEETKEEVGSSFSEHEVIVDLPDDTSAHADDSDVTSILRDIASSYFPSVYKDKEAKVGTKPPLVYHDNVHQVLSGYGNDNYYTGEAAPAPA